MECVNETLVREFVFLGFSSLAGLQRLLFAAFLLVYLFTLGTNAIIISTIVLDRALHTPMYFFLTVLSCFETCYTFVIIPKMLVDLLAQKKTISFLGCAMQMFSFLFLGCSHSFLLAAMGYDRYVAICDPLRYTLLMGYGMCLGLVAAACACGFTVSLVTTSLVFHLPFHSSNRLHHFFCDIKPLLELACGNTDLNEWLLHSVTGTIAMVPFSLTLLSYFYIIIYLFFKTHSCSMLHKALSTCASHFMVVVLFYAPVIFTYIRPASGSSMDQERIIAIMYSVVTPVLNPLIYTLRNKEVKGALRRAM